MAKQVQLPDGNIAEFPDNMADDQIAGVLRQQYPAAPQSSPQVPQSTFMDAVEGFNRSFGRMAEGVIGLVATGRVKQGLEQYNAQQEQSLQEAQYRSPWATGAGQLAGAIGAGVAYSGMAAGAGGSAVARFAPQAAKGIASFAAANPITAAGVAGASVGAGLSAAEYAPTMQDRLMKGAVGGLLGGVLGAGAKALSQFLYPHISPQKAAEEQLARNIKSDLGENTLQDVRQTLNKSSDLTSKTAADKLRGLLQPSEELNLNRTPGQVVGGLTRTRELTMGASPTQQEALRMLQRSQSADTLAKVNNMIDDMAPGEVVKTQELLKGQLQSTVVPQNVVDNLKLQGPIGREFVDLKLNPKISDSIKNLPDNSLLKLDAVKNNIDDALYSNAHALDPVNKMTDLERRGLEEARSMIVNTLDNTPGLEAYAPYRKASQQVLLREKYGNMLLKVRLKPGQQGEAGLDEIANKLFPTPEAQQIFIRDIAEAGGSPEVAQKVITVVDQLRQNPLGRIAGRTSLENDLASTYANHATLAQRIISKLTGDRARTAMYNLITDQKTWAPKILKILEGADEATQNINMLKIFNDASKTPMQKAGAIGGKLLKSLPAAGLLGQQGSKLAPTSE